MLSLPHQANVQRPCCTVVASRVFALQAQVVPTAPHPNAAASRLVRILRPLHGCGLCVRCMALELPARTVQILAEAYELNPDEIEHDVTVLHACPRSGVKLLVWLRDRHQWHASTCVYYLAALRRALRGQSPVMCAGAR